VSAEIAPVLVRGLRIVDDLLGNPSRVLDSGASLTAAAS
jgi:hypothetical protein